MILMRISSKRYLKLQIRKAANLAMMMKAMTIKKKLTIPKTLPMTLRKKMMTTMMKAMMKKTLRTLEMMKMRKRTS